MSLGRQRAAQQPQAARVDARTEAAESYLDYTLAVGPDKGKTMRQFWTDYQAAFIDANAGKKDAPTIKINYVAQQSALGGLLFDVFVVERVDGEQGRLYPFRVDLETGEVTTATGCLFAPAIARDYAAEKCLPAAEIFPEGI